jgi:hypothetical protein
MNWIYSCIYAESWYFLWILKYIVKESNRDMWQSVHNLLSSELWHRRQGDIYNIFERTFCLLLYSEDRGGMSQHKFGDHIPDCFVLEDENWNSCKLSATSYQTTECLKSKAAGSYETSVNIYRYELHNDVSVNDGPHIRRWFHKIMIL